ncbi:MAG: alpha/beta fold hydrolase [Bacteroidetes bacterium]|nr:alpha/beta fold hydrolase [Bacteroidota bacterium]
MKLHYREIGLGQPLVILHGLFGSSDNWQTQAKRFAEYFRVILVDLRNHGHSDWNDDSSYLAMANDVIELLQDLHLEKTILLGHSMGGKVAMHVAQNHPLFLDKLIVVDMGMKEYPPHHQHILQGIHSVKLKGVTSRSEADKQLSNYIDTEGVKQFLLKNLYWKEKGQLAWRMNVSVLENSMGEILSAVPKKEVFLPTVFIRGELSNYILEEDFSDIENYFVDSQFITIQNSGHWVHAEKPEEFIDAVLNFCLR